MLVRHDPLLIGDCIDNVREIDLHDLVRPQNYLYFVDLDGLSKALLDPGIQPHTRRQFTAASDPLDFLFDHLLSLSST